MLEEHSNRINALFDMYLARIEHDIKNAPPEALPTVGESILNMYALKQNITTTEDRSRMEIRILKNLDDMMNNKGGKRGGIG